MANSLLSKGAFFALFVGVAVVAVGEQSRQVTTQLTAPTGERVRVPATVPSVSLTKPVGPPAVPDSVSEYDYEAHMNFQRSEDALGDRIDILKTDVNGRLDQLKETVDEDHKDIGDLKDTRSRWQGYMIAGGVIWVVVTGLFNKDKILSWLQTKLGTSG